MIKKCMSTDLMYLCKTTTNAKKDPYEYKGSGKYWLRHIKKHKPHIITCVVGEYETREELKRNGDLLSQRFNVVESVNWANIVPERGDGGWIHNQTGNRWTVSDTGRQNMKRSRELNRQKYIEAWKQLKIRSSGGNNYQSTHFIHTPWGTFETYRDALNEAKKLRSIGRRDVITDNTTLRKYCEGNIILNEQGRRTHPSWRGKSTKVLGFYKERK